MSKTYKGWEFLKAIEEKKIKDGTKLRIISNGIYIDMETTAIVEKDALNNFILKNTEFNNGLCANWLINTTIEITEDEIDIDNIEEYKQEHSERCIDIDIRNKINELIQAIKQLNNKIN